MLADVVTEIAGRLKVDAVQIDVSLPVPPGTGLGTSAAQGVAVTAVCARYSGYEVSRDALAELAAAAERSAGIAGGRQDQYAAAHGGCHLWQIGPGQQPAVGARITLAPALTSAFVLAHPGGTRDSGNLVDVIAQRQQDDGAIRTALRRLNELAAPIAATLTCGDLPALAEHLHAVRQLQRALHPAVVDTRVEEKLHALPGVLAAKPCGGGGTGAAWLVLCQPGAADTVTAMLPAAGLHAITVEPDPQGVATTGPADPGAHPR
ncbi:hypothetical protein [Cryptosporangium sp. NPDC051539]|uniref:GHMP family kinase ATP-binding protein n=1 Tax=Cryptosporangium sp. NPDC051539 TaxID=3363962 RepID=UPI00379029B0